MSEYIRKIVSGNKARFKDPNLNLELDLVYVTDNVIIMGFPASGVEGIYRNRREDAKRFLEHRHGKNYWIFNLCPIKENSYDKNYFDGRVSRYPFPDHHAPPLAIMALVSREMKAWHSGSKDRVSVLHCKAGKGRSGTMTCSYLLSLDEIPSSPKLAFLHLTAKQWAEKRALEVTQIVPDDEEPDLESPLETTPNLDILESLQTGNTIPSPVSPTKSFSESLHSVLDLHSNQRMKQSSTGPPKQRKGVSIASQKRFLTYWSLILGNEQPPSFWKLPSSDPLVPKVKINQITVRMKESGNIMFGLANVASTVMDTVAKRKLKSSGAPIDKDTLAAPVWASLARYDDDLVDILEKWERHTREGEGSKMGIRREDSDYIGDDALSELFDPPSGSKWDSVKMVHSFARMGMEKGRSPDVQKDPSGKPIWSYPLRCLSGDRWENVKDQIEEKGQDVNTGGGSESFAEEFSLHDLTDDVPPAPVGVVVNAHREVRIKLYYGRVWMGWCWFIPAFHIAPDEMKHGYSFKLVLARKDLDFAVGIAKDIVEVEVDMCWLKETQSSAA